MYSEYKRPQQSYIIKRIDNGDTIDIENITEWCENNWVDKHNLLLTYEDKLTFANSRLTGTSYKLIEIKRDVY
jgi:hypothetical protein